MKSTKFFLSLNIILFFPILCMERELANYQAADAFNRSAIVSIDNFAVRHLQQESNRFSCDMRVIPQNRSFIAQREIFQDKIKNDYYRYLHSREGYKLSTKMQVIEQEINHTLNILRNCCLKDEKYRLYLPEFVSLKIQESTLNSYLISTKEKMARILFKNGVPQKLTESDRKDLNKLIDSLEKQTKEWFKYDYYTIVKEIDNASSSYKCFNDSQLEKQLSSSQPLQQITEVMDLCKKDEFQKAAEIINQNKGFWHFVNESRQVHKSFLRKLYLTHFKNKFDEFGIDKKFQKDPLYKTIRKHIIAEQCSLSTVERIKKNNAIPIPDEKMKEFFIYREELYNNLLQTVGITKPSPEVSEFLYNVVLFLDDTQNFHKMAHFCAHGAYRDSYMLEEKDVYDQLFDERGLPKFLDIFNNELLKDINIPANIHFKEHAIERECLFNLARLDVNDEQLKNIVNDGIQCIMKACDTENLKVALAYRSLAQSFVHAIYHQQSDALLKCGNVLQINTNERHIKLQLRLIPIIASLAERIHHSNLVVNEEKKYAEDILLSIDDLYGKVIHQNSVFSENKLQKICNRIEQQNLVGAFKNDGLFINPQETIIARFDIDEQKQFGLLNIIEEEKNALIKCNPIETVEKTFGLDAQCLEYIFLNEQERAIVSDIDNNQVLIEKINTIVTDMQNEAPSILTTTIPSNIGELSLKEYIAYINELQEKIALRRDAFFIGLGSKHRQAINKCINILSKYSEIAGLELLKKAVETTDMIQHPIEATYNLVKGTGQLLHFMGKFAVAYSGDLPLQDLQIQYRKEIDEVLTTLYELPTYQKFSLLINYCADTFVWRGFSTVLVKTKPLLINASNQLLQVGQQVIKVPEQFNLINKLRNLAQKEVRAIEAIEWGQGAVRSVEHGSKEASDIIGKVKDTICKEMDFAPKDIDLSNAHKVAETSENTSQISKMQKAGNSLTRKTVRNKSGNCIDPSKNKYKPKSKVSAKKEIIETPEKTKFSKRAEKQNIKKNKKIAEQPGKKLSKEIEELHSKFDGLEKGYDVFEGKDINFNYEHVCQPDITISGKASGWHHDVGGWFKNQIRRFKGKEIEILSMEKVQHGIYELEWRYMNGKVKTSTFFPSDWSRTKVHEKVFEAFNYCKQKKKLFEFNPQKSNWILIGKTNEGIKIKMVFNKSGKIITYYPVFKG
ncbi:MAG: EndoU domain-containing protein [Candidatus Babeliales bacterium]